MTLKELFNFVTDSTITEHNLASYLNEAMTISATRGAMSISELIDERVRADDEGKASYMLKC